MRSVVVTTALVFGAFVLLLPSERGAIASPLMFAAAAPRDSMCDPQHGDVSQWKTETTPAMMFSHPPDYSSERIDTSWHAAGWDYRGHQYRLNSILVGWSGKYDTLDLALQYDSRFSTCIAVIGGRAATVSTYGRFAIPSAVVARWTSQGDMPPVYLAIFARERVTLAEMRQIFWTVHFGGMKPDTSEALRCATPIRPRGELSDFLDTALVGTLAQSLWAALPRGYTIVGLSFDSSGDVGAVDLLAGDLPVKSQKDLAMIVASNAKTQPPAASPAAVRVEVTEKGYAYQLIPVSACPKK